MRKLRLKKVKYLDQWHIVGSGRARLGPTPLPGLEGTAGAEGEEEETEKKKDFGKVASRKNFLLLLFP